MRGRLGGSDYKLKAYRWESNHYPPWKEMLCGAMSLEEVARKTGISTHFLRKDHHIFVSIAKQDLDAAQARPGHVLVWRDEKWQQWSNDLSKRSIKQKIAGFGKGR